MKLMTFNGYEYEIDDEDFGKIIGYRWYGGRRKYVRKNGEILRHAAYLRAHVIKNGIHTNITMHRLIMNPPPDKQIDHIDGNGLNNKKNNLRICTATENMRNCKRPINNSSGYKGVTWHKYNKKWRATIVIHNKQRLIGYFKNKELAHLAYVDAAKECFGSFSRV